EALAVLLRDVDELRLCLGVSDIVERSGLPVLGRDARLALALAREAAEDLCRGRIVAREVADPPRTPARLAGNARGGIPLGERGIGSVGAVVRAALLLDAAHGVERLGGLAAVGEAPGQVAEQPEGGGIVVGVPPPVGGLAERAGAVGSDVAA